MLINGSLISIENVETRGTAVICWFRVANSLFIRLLSIYLLHVMEYFIISSGIRHSFMSAFISKRIKPDMSSSQWMSSLKLVICFVHRLMSI